jgi:succinate dehydrogenase hydrophobic anchor subunit
MKENSKMKRELKTQRWIFVISTAVVVLGIVLLFRGEYAEIFLKANWSSGRAIFKNPFSVFFFLAFVMFFLSARNIIKLSSEISNYKKKFK